MIHKIPSDWKATITYPGTGPVERRIQITPEIAQWEYLYFRMYTFYAGLEMPGESAGDEMVMVLLSGAVQMETGGNKWLLDGRKSVFEGCPFVIYLPPGYEYKMTVLSDADCAYSRAAAEGKYKPRLIVPDEIKVEQIGEGEEASRISYLLNPGDTEKLLCTELIVPSGHWGEAPDHKHRVEPRQDGSSINRVNFYQTRPEIGWGLQRLYNPDQNVDEAIVIHHGDAVMIRQNSHPFCAAPNTHLYCLSFLAGDKPEWELT